MASIYIHIPYCKQKCTYCDFHFRTNQIDKSEMLASINEEINIRKSYLDGDIINSIYFGGGTPSILNDKEIKALIDTIYNCFIVKKNVEITLECNPDDLNLQSLKKIKETGINRLSIGVQSFDDNDLVFMNRSHNAKEAFNSIRLAQSLGFKNITIDLIYGLPKQSNNKWKDNLKILLELNIPHFSAYALTVEPKTKLKHLIDTKKITPLEDEIIIEQFNTLLTFADKNNFIHYEISNFGKEGCFSNHNTSYWKNKNYLGVGPSAHSFNGLSRSWNISSNKKYIEGIQKKDMYNETEILNKQQQYNEYIFTNLRTIWGVNLDYILTEFDVKTKNYFKKGISRWIDQEKINNTENNYTLTKKGKLYADAIASDLFIV